MQDLEPASDEAWDEDLPEGEQEPEDKDLGPPPVSGPTLPFYSVSPVKLTVLSFSTLGLYQLLWFYENWVSISAQPGEKRRRGRALFQTLFAPILYWDLAGQIDARARSAGLAGVPNPMLLGALYFGMCLLVRLPDPYWILELLSFLPLLPAAIHIARLHAALRPGVDTRVGWGVGTWVTLVLGGGLTALTLFVTLLAPE